MRYWFYRAFQRFIHKRHYHKMEVSWPEGDTMYWCKWCGLRVVLKRDHLFGMKILQDAGMPRNTIIFTNIKVPE